MRVRKAHAGDYAAFARLFPELGIDDPIPDAGVFEREMMATTLMAELDGHVVGLASYQVLSGTGHLRIIITAKDVRRKGVGRMLMRAVQQGLCEVGCGAWMLNVLPTNAPAIALYERMGLERVLEAKALRIPWSAVETMPVVSAVLRPIAPDDDARIEAELEIPSGLLALRRSQPWRILRMIDEGDRPVAACAFDPAFPGAHPFRAVRVDLAIALLRALSPHARPADTFLNVAIEGQEDLAQALVAHGASVRFAMLQMRGAIDA